MLMIRCWFAMPSAREDIPNLREADESDLRGRHCTGNIEFLIGSADFSADWGWIPLIDFVVSLALTAKELDAGAAESVFEFTESNNQIRFRRERDSILVTTTYASGIGKASLAEFKEAIRHCATNLRDELISTYPTLKENKSFASLMGFACARDPKPI